jgi:ubiquinone/menaquinone biosynthesis C-methylase UbiE
MPPLGASAKTQAAATYNAAADSFDDPALAFWDLIGRRTIDRLRLKLGDRVLDAACGTGASALPAAQAVGLSGNVVAIDLAERLLELARAKAQRLSLQNVEFKLADMEQSGFADGSFDAVVCVFGIFFVPEMTHAMRELWRMVREGGQLAITTWGPRALEPESSAFWKAVEAERPDLVRGFNPWDRISTAPALEQLFHSSGIAEVRIAEESYAQPVSSPDDWWTIALGTGFRGTIEQLDPAAQKRVRAANVAQLEKIREIEVNALYAIAAKP